LHSIARQKPDALQAHVIQCWLKEMYTSMLIADTGEYARTKLDNDNDNDKKVF